MAAPTIRGVGTRRSSVNAITADTLPAGTVAGDLLIMFCQTSNQAITVSGWTEVPTVSPQSSGTAGAADGNRLTALYRVATGTDADDTSDSGDHQLVQVIGIQTGTYDTGTPINASAGGTQAATTSVTISGPTTSVDDCLIIACSGANGPDAAGDDTEFSGWANAALASITERFDTVTTTGHGGALGMATGVLALAGAVGDTTATAANSFARANICLAIAPVVVAATGLPVLAYHHAQVFGAA